VVVVVPPISDRYYSFQFLDAYTNDYAYLGQRASGGNGGTYLIAGPDWNGQVPERMTKIWTLTNLAWLITRTLVKSPADVANVNAIQDLRPTNYKTRQRLAISSNDTSNQSKILETLLFLYFLPPN
jgi:hypothetical protein